MLPTYQIIINSLQEQIQKGQYKDDEKLPSEAKLMEEFNTSRITVTRALKELEHRGIIYRQKGKGSFVNPRKKSPGDSKILSLLLPHKIDFFSGGQQYTHHIFRCCRDQGYLCSVHYSEQSSRREKQILDEISQHQVAGAIIYPINNRNVDTLSRMSIDGFPMVLLDRNLQELNLPVVQSDNFRGAREAVQFLVEKAHRKIGFVGAMDSDAVSQRYQGYCRALTGNRIPLDPELVVTSFSSEREEEQSVLTERDARHTLKKLLKQKVTAIFCVNDLIAFRLLNAARDLNIEVPQDLSLVGFDNLKYLSDTRWQLTTVAQDFESLARNSVDILINMIHNGPKDPPENCTVPTSFLEGNTVV